MTDITRPEGLTSRERPSLYTDGQPRTPRLGARAEAYALALLGSKLALLADEGSYFVATNPTPGTGVAGKAAPTALADTAALMHVHNNETDLLKGKRLYLDFLLLRPTAAGTNGTNFNLTQKIDRGPTRYASGGSNITPVNPNMGSSETSPAVVKVGDLTLGAATSSARLVHHEQVRSVIKVIGDKYLLTFGNSSPPTIGMAMEGTAQAAIHLACPPVVLGPGDQWCLHEWAASQSVAAGYEFVLGFFAR